MDTGRFPLFHQITSHPYTYGDHELDLGDYWKGVTGEASQERIVLGKVGEELRRRKKGVYMVMFHCTHV